MRNKILRLLLVWIGYPVFFVVSFVLSAYLTFPYEMLRDFIVQEVERPLGPGGERTPSGYRLEIDDLSPSWLTGVSVTGVRFTKPPSTPDGRPLNVRLDAATARVGVLCGLTGNLCLSFSARLAGGTVDGSVSTSGDTQHVELNLASVDLRQLGILRDLVGLPFAGSIEGHVNATIAPRPAETSGAVRITVRRFAFGDGQAKLKIEDLGMGSGLTVERVDVGDLVMNLDVENGVARIVRFGAEGRDVDLSLTGNVRVVQPVTLSRVDMLLAIKFNDSYRNRSDRTRGLFSLVDLVPQLQQARAPDGALQFRLEGSPGTAVRYTPAGNVPRDRPRGG